MEQAGHKHCQEAARGSWLAHATPLTAQWPWNPACCQGGVTAGWQRGGRGVAVGQWAGRKAVRQQGSSDSSRKQARALVYSWLGKQEDPTHCPAALPPCSERCLCFPTSCSTVEKGQNWNWDCFCSLNYINYIQKSKSRACLWLCIGTCVDWPQETGVMTKLLLEKYSREI